MNKWPWDEPPTSDSDTGSGALGAGALGRMILPQRLDTDAAGVERDLLKLVLTIIELIRQLMEKQALRRIDEDDLTEEQIEGLGNGLMHLEEAMEALKAQYGLTTEDLNIDLGPLGTLL
ncbi:MAG: gas vesicle protein K [Intrasporangium sp.]|uniref:gas vesicle protein K n=1 Tax=Intrasporangium sp. TaxID=1925024 RepID=UPI003F7D3BCA